MEVRPRDQTLTEKLDVHLRSIFFNILPYLFFALGSKISQHVGKHLHKYIIQREEYRRGEIEEAIRMVRIFLALRCFWAWTMATKMGAILGVDIVSNTAKIVDFRENKVPRGSSTRV
jgi:activator of 2-hydroxyglutaryl-CoA dehydratase